MNAFSRSTDLDKDIEDILDYTIDNFGADQAFRYLASLEACFRKLAEMPGMGRPCPAIGNDLFRFEHESHVIFYLRRPSGIFLCRALQKSRMPGASLFDSSLTES